MERMLELNSVVTQVMNLSPTNIILRVSPQGWEIPNFEAGQFAVLYLPGSSERCEGVQPEYKDVEPSKMIRRAYSIASSSKNKEFLEFYITLVYAGGLSPRLFNLKPGDKIGMSTKFTGMFTLENVPKDVNLVAIATGTGIAPYISMLRSNTFANPKRKIAVLHGAHNSWDLGYSSELSLLDATFPNFSYIPTITNVDGEIIPWGGEIGRVGHIWNSKILDKKWDQELNSGNTHIFLCGNPNMINDTIGILEGEGFVEQKGKVVGQIHAEKW